MSAAYDICLSTVNVNMSLDKETCARLISDISQNMMSIAEANIPSRKYVSYLMPFWLPELMRLCKIRDRYHTVWKQAGKPRGHSCSVFKNFKKAKREFRAEFRQAEKDYESKWEQDIKEAESIDQGYFWYLVKKARKILDTKVEPILNDEGEIMTYIQDILQCWKSYCSKLATPDSSDTYDVEFMQHVEEVILRIDNCSLAWPSEMFEIPFSTSEILNASQKLKYKKAPGWDGVTAQHIRYSGTDTIILMTMIFNSMTSQVFVPDHFKKGICIPLYKGGGKKREVRESHRGITLLPVLSKWYEHLMMGRAEEWIRKTLDPLQGAGQKGGSSMMSTLLLRETICHNVEGGNTVYVVLLDVQRAFDTVWIDGLFYQLYKQGIDYKLWKLLRQYYKDFQCCIRIGGELSQWFTVYQGVHQGGVWSMPLYQLFINSLLVLLRSSGAGRSVCDVYCGCSTHADDQTLIGLYQQPVQRMVDKSYEHSCKWRYKYSIPKCVAQVYSSSRTPVMPKFTLGGVVVPNKLVTLHMGVPLGVINVELICGFVNKGKRNLGAVQGLSR